MVEKYDLTKALKKNRKKMLKDGTISGKRGNYARVVRGNKDGIKRRDYKPPIHSEHKFGVKIKIKDDR